MSRLDNSILDTIALAELAVVNGDFNNALNIVYSHVDRIITEPVCTAQVFASNDLDLLCLRIGRQSLASLTKLPIDSKSDQIGTSTVVYLVSRLQRSGGHSRLVQDFIRSQPEKNHLILSTEIGGPSDKDHYSKIFKHLENVRFIRAPRGNFQARLAWLQSTLLAIQPQHVYLLNHHQDSVAVSALVPELGIKGSFIHHGDHHLCLGVHMEHLNHVDLHPMGYNYCREELGVENRYLPLTFEDKQSIPIQTSLRHDQLLTTATAAGSNKIEIPYYVSYLDLIPRVLQTTGGKHIHIGRLTPWARWRIYRQMRTRGVGKDRFVYIKWVPSVWETLQEHKVDLYLASFPYGAGLTLIEAMGAGVPVIMHQHMYSRVLSSLELAYPEAYSWSDPERLLEHLSQISRIELEREKVLARNQYETFHRPEILRNFFQENESLTLPVPKLNQKFKPRLDEWASWAQSQLSFTRLFYQFLYRSFRKMRLLLS